MHGIAISSVLCLLCFDHLAAETIQDYSKKRANWIEVESQQSLGNKLVLDNKEILANDILMKRKKVETDCDNSHYLNFTGSFFTFRDDMRRSSLYQFIRRMPKGSLLHVHSSLMLNSDQLLQLTYEDHLYVCLTDLDLKFRFSSNTPKQYCAVQWYLISKLRGNHKNVTEFDAMVKERLTLGPEDHVGPYANTDQAWKDLKRTISTIFSLLKYRPVREKMIYQSFQNIYEDKIMYVEIRLGLHHLYELNGTEHDKMYMTSLYNQIAQKFMKTNPDFAGFKFIVTASRNLNVEQLREELIVARKVKQMLPELFAGFDLVGQEDRVKPLTSFLPVLLEAKDEIDYFFHAGETNSYGTPVDENLFDATLLGTKRIGHGNALIKHPALIQAVHQNDIAVEVNVISNSVLSLVQDLRNHPLATYLALGLPVVLSSDDPGVWGAKPLSDDFYVAFVAIASKHADLRMLKQLAINSIRYSALDDTRKKNLHHLFEKKWSKFIDEVTSDLDGVALASTVI